MLNRLVGLLRAGGLVVATPAPGLVPSANFPAGEEAKEGKNFIPSAILTSSGSSSSPANRAREEDAANADEVDWLGKADEVRAGRVGVWNEDVEGDHQSEDMALISGRRGLFGTGKVMKRVEYIS
jgi:hypothetical protein